MLLRQSIQVFAASWLFCYFNACIVARAVNDEEFIRFGNMYGSNMVVQKAPSKLIFWGYFAAKLSSDEAVTVISTAHPGQTFFASTSPADFNGSAYQDLPVRKWHAELPPVNASNTEHKFTVRAGKLSTEIEHVLVGDVWVCSGQSNMEFNVAAAFGGKEAIEDAHTHKTVRILSVRLLDSEKPLDELKAIAVPWSQPSPSTLVSNDGTYYSAVCYWYALKIQKHLNYPIGVIQSAYGGSPILAWLSPDGHAKCPGEELPMRSLMRFNHGKSTLWNAMMVGLTHTPIYGALWYQGEADSLDNPETELYPCRFPAMISDWRQKWFENTNGQTDKQLPFGFVQLSTWDNNHNNTCGPKDGCNVAKVRWAQTANYGYVPNEKMPRTFMAVAVDYGDSKSPAGDIHPRYKEPVADRLALAGLDIAYNLTVGNWRSPIANSAQLQQESTVALEFSLDEPFTLSVHNPLGFEVSDGSKWVPAEIEEIRGQKTVIIKPSGLKHSPKQVRYNWYQAPCAPNTGPLLCALYTEDKVPVAPFIVDVSQSEISYPSFRDDVSESDVLKPSLRVAAIGVAVIGDLAARA